VLTGDHVYESLVDKVASTSAAQFAGKKLVVAGAPETSFLMDKLEGKLGPARACRCRVIGSRSLTADRGDPQVDPRGRAEGARRGGSLTSELDRQPRIRRRRRGNGLPGPHAPFMLGDRPETEGCQMVRLGNPEAIDVGQWELFMHEGPPLILRAYRCGDADGDGTNDCDEPDFDAKFPSGFAPCEQFGYGWSFMVGAQTPHYLVDSRPRRRRRPQLRKNQPLLLNSHYTNPFADTMAEVWVNVTPSIRRS